MNFISFIDELVNSKIIIFRIIVIIRIGGSFNMANNNDLKSYYLFVFQQFFHNNFFQLFDFLNTFP